MSTQPSLVYIVPDKVGGMMNIIANLLQYRQPNGFRTEVLLTHNHLSTDTRFDQPLPCDVQSTFEYTLPIENLRTVLRRMARAVPRGPGVVVAGDLLDLALLSVYDTGRAVVLILHGDHDYYYDLAVKHDAVVHAYVAASRRCTTAWSSRCRIARRRSSACRTASRCQRGSARRRPDRCG